MDLSNYKALSEKVTQKFSEISQRRPLDFKCKIGCHSCCVPGISVFPIEREHIREFLRKNPEHIDRLRQLAKANPHHGKRCGLLDSQGACSVYEARPLVCRSHGAPLLVRLENGDVEVDACPLNFTDSSLGGLPTEDRIQLETLNTLLTLVNRAAFPESKAERHALTVENLLSGI